MRLPWGKRETRASEPFTDAVVSAIVANAGGTTGDPGATAAVETASGLWERAFAAAVVSPSNARTRALTPALLGMIGRQLVRRGEALFVIGVDGGEVRLRTARRKLGRIRIAGPGHLEIPLRLFRPFWFS